MKKNTIEKLQNQFDALSRTVPDEDVEFWFARDLQEPWDTFGGKTLSPRLSAP